MFLGKCHAPYHDCAVVEHENFGNLNFDVEVFWVGGRWPGHTVWNSVSWLVIRNHEWLLSSVE
jgi:hypothetical protein